ncbi:MAG: ArsR family transcriptional regulator [Candidatus Lokiarchaeota archaeon]|nr:ArsR family transcriptional regulator [Candidatus Lokiarchaeota archaeon]
MEDVIDSEEAKKVIRENINALSSLLKALSQDNRLKILSLLLDGEKEFHQFKENLTLSKTALANHLSVLLDNNLIKKIERGSYDITKDGKDLILSIVLSYRKSQIHSLEIRKRLWNKYLPEKIESSSGIHNKFIVEIPAKYVPGWISYVSSITGVLKSLNKNIDQIDVAGNTGHAFFFNVAEGITDPSGPSCVVKMHSFHEGIEVFGWKLKEWYQPLSRDTSNLPIKPDLFKKIFNAVKDGLERMNRPVILWGIPIPEYGIVNGYEDDKYIVSTFRSSDPEKRFGPDTDTKFDDIVPPGRMQALFFEETVLPPEKEKSDLRSIRNALNLSNLHQKGSGYISGPNAFYEWAEVIEGEIEFISYHGNSYISKCIYEALCFANEYISRIARRYSDIAQYRYLINASDQFKEAKSLMKQYEVLFPFAFDGDLNYKKRQRGAEILRKIAPYISGAFANMSDALENWE